MLFRQLTHDDLGCASYLVGDEGAGVAAVVDPRLDIDEYLRLARYSGVHVEHILETHNHADHVSGHGRLAAATGATIHIHPEAGAEYAHEPFDDGWELELGEVTVRALHTPGHRPEHTAFALVDAARGGEPWAVLTGDSLFVGDIARPDLAVDKEEGARGIFHSLHEKLLTLPDTCEIWPGHLGGSLCGGPGVGMKGSSTIGYERAHSELLPMDAGDEVGQRVVLVGRDDEDARHAAELAESVAVTRIAGFLAGGMTSWREERLPVERIERITVPELREREGELQVLDVREQSEWDAGHITGSVHTPYHDIHAVPDGIDPERPVAVICSSGQRAAPAASLLRRHGVRDVLHVVDGGVPAYMAS